VAAEARRAPPIVVVGFARQQPTEEKDFFEAAIG
jgi:hypothetical protein